ncbi:MAG: GNAT family N-acetyltransferase [Woeseiaceae bacterium]|nr:GNAT family N-acetyltransferase [Woeseiaceae bacterium]NIP21714.1 GNAT family N-acetyltransferase [Woeseiaceae bacterium]NIS90800.1 GNAT family N-acetyltransferase [Woeseiaceae bacterium]
MRDQLYMSDCAIADEEDKVKIIEYFLENLHPAGYRWDVFVARDTLENSCIATVLNGLSSYRVASKNTDYCSVITVSPYDEMLRRITRNFRKNVTKRRRKLEELPDVVFSVESDPAKVASTFDEFLVLESSGWKAGKSRARGDVPEPFAIALNEKKKNFYKRVVTAFAERNQMRVVCVRVGPHLIAARFWLLLNEVCYSLKTAYDEAYSAYSPGVLAFDHGLRQIAETGGVREINTITSGRAADDWKPEKLRYQSMICFANSVTGKVIYLAYRIRAALRNQ